MFTIRETEDIWTYLSRATKPIVLYGMGNGADKILSALAGYGVEVSDFFASDDFVRGHFFHGKRVLRFSEVKEKYDDFIILVSFASSLPDVMARIYDLDAEYELYVPDVPLFGGELFTREYFCAHEAEIFAAYGLLADERSRQVFSAAVNFKLSGKLKYLSDTQNDKIDIANQVLRCYNYKKYLDGGAYTGDSVIEFCRLCPDLDTVYAFEPDGKTFKKLSENTAALSDKTVYLYNKGLWREAGMLSFHGTAGRNSALLFSDTGVPAKKTDVLCTDADTALMGAPVDFIKLDVEGAEAEAIDGAQNTIRTYTPDMQISIYHRSCDLFSIPLKIEALHPAYRYYIRRIPYIPLWDMNLYAIKA